MSGLYLSSGAQAGANQVEVIADGDQTTIRTATADIVLNGHGQTVIKASCHASQEGWAVSLWTTPAWLSWLIGERLSVRMRVKPRSD